MKEKILKKNGRRRNLTARQMGRCAYCGEELVYKKKAERVPSDGASKPTLDHIIPVSKGGSDDENNLVVVHYRCNLVKGDLMPEEILKLLENMRITFESRLNQ